MNRENPRSPFVDDPLDRAVAEIAARQRALDGEGEAPLVTERVSPSPSPWLISSPTGLQKGGEPTPHRHDTTQPAHRLR